MFSYKMKNYVLLDERGKLLIKGSGLRSRGIELFQRLWMEEMFRLLLDRAPRRDPRPASSRWEEDFRAHRVPVKQFMKTETLQESLGGVPREAPGGRAQCGRRLRAGAPGSSAPYQPGDQVSYYVTGRLASGSRSTRRPSSRPSWNPERARREHRLLRGQAAGAATRSSGRSSSGTASRPSSRTSRAPAAPSRAGPVTTERGRPPSPDQRELARPRGRLARGPGRRGCAPGSRPRAASRSTRRSISSR